MATNLDHRLAKQDPDVLERLEAAAEQEGIQMSEFWVKQNIGTLISVDVDPGDGFSSIADVLAFNRLTFVRQLRLGENPEFVTDEQLREAIRKTVAATTSTAPVPIAEA